jgi:peptide/nickel transport system substrate-binding protein
MDDREGAFVRRYMKLLALVAVVGLVATACAGGDEEGPAKQAPGEDIPTGGTLNLAMLGDVSHAFDPQKEYYNIGWSFMRCCLLRTLLSYNGKPTEERGTELFPDLAADQPTVSEDLLTWTFTLKDGINYAPPFQDTPIVAQDFIRAMEREADPKAAAGGYSNYYAVIEGFQEFSDGEAESISGMTAVDDKTLEIRLTEPTGDLGFRLAMPAAAPIPEGASDGHVEDYGRFLVSSGPYMFEGSEALDFSVDPKDQEPAAGYVPERSIILVRNPSWDKATDDLRPAYVDRIEVTIGGTEEDLANKVDNAEIDLVFDGVPPAQQIRKYQADPELEDQINSYPSDGQRYISFNLAEPPFDDIHVRKALNLALDKDGMRRLRGGELFGDIAGHIIVDSLLNNQLKDYDPYATPNSQGDIEAAKEEMRQSKYDTDGDGVCDDPSCQNILTFIDEADPYPDQTALQQDNFEPLGLTFDVKSGERSTFMYDTCNDPGAHAAYCPSPAWGKDFADAFTFADPLFGREFLGPDSCCNYSLVGAEPAFLQEAGYEVTEVPSIEDKLAECAPLTGDERITCYAEMDQLLMEEVVPWVPYLFDNNVDVISSRIVNYSFDQFAGNAALDHMAIAADQQ